jgi:putative transposase
MGRKVRLEYAGACYHVISRGNYKSWIFETEGARKSFRRCLVQVCQAKGWHLHAWCLMSNHYHLLLETPESNLVEGMKWLQGTFASRFNRFRKESGHVFQGRYKAIIVDGDALGPVAHYIHLNPVRAGIVEAQQLYTYADSSFHQFWYPRCRWSFARMDLFLDAAGGLTDTLSGRKLYRDYLAWLSADDSEQKRLGFERMCRGWIKGAKEFKKAIMEDSGDLAAIWGMESEANEIKELRWEKALCQSLSALGKSEADLVKDGIRENWKLALGCYLHEHSLIAYRWLAERLHAGAVKSFANRILYYQRHKRDNDPNWTKLIFQHSAD